MSRLAAALLVGYRALLSPLLHQATGFSGGCRFSPTCSRYGLAAIRQYGLSRGFVLLSKRLGRCHPWSPGGCDPLPSRGPR